jgi:hypothetical protein
MERPLYYISSIVGLCRRGKTKDERKLKQVQAKRGQGKSRLMHEEDEREQRTKGNELWMSK